MSFKTSSRQLPDGDQAPSEEATALDGLSESGPDATEDVPAAEVPAAEPPADNAPAEEKPANEASADDEAAEAPEAAEAAEAAEAEPEAKAATAENEPADETTATDGPADERVEEQPDEQAAEQPDEQAAEQADEQAEKVSAGNNPAEEAPVDTAKPEPAPAEPTAEGTSTGTPTGSPADEPAGAAPGEVTTPGRRGRWRGWRDKYPVAARGLSWTINILAAALVFIALLMPNSPEDFRPSSFVRVPVEAIFGAAVLIVLPRRPRLVVAALSGLALGAMTILSFLDVGFKQYLGRGFNVILDWGLFSDALAYLKDTFGEKGAIGATVAVVALVIVLLALTTLAVVRLSGLLSRHTARATRATLVLGTVWITCTSLGVQFSGVPIASEHTAGLVQERMQRAQETLRDEAAFKKVAKKDVFANTPPDQLLTGLRGKDMMITFIESYGRSAIEDPVMAPGVDATLTAENKKLTDAGFAAKSGWLTSATYGGSSWLGHSTFLSGLWISNQQRYRTVTAGERLTLPGAFKKTGAWDTVGVMPGVQKAWPEQSFYGIDKLYDSRKLGYKGPKFSWSTMPDQYALTAFERLVHSKKHDKPLMSTIILTSSHQPWAPIPELVPQDQVGDGSIYNAIEKAGKKAADIITDSAKSKVEYGKSIQYSVSSLINYLVQYGNDNTVLIFLGDHQPISRVSGNHASRDVPVSIVAKDPKVLDKIADWNWADGLQPKQDTPVWKMDAFRDRFLTAYGSTPKP